jgi:hypothetical protein
MQHVQSVESFVSNVFQVARLGGKVWRRDDDTLLISDLGSMTCSQINVIQKRFPHIKLHITGSEASASGFIVICHLVAGSHTAFSSYVRIGIYLCLYCLCCLFMLTSHQAYVSRFS